MNEFHEEVSWKSFIIATRQEASSVRVMVESFAWQIAISFVWNSKFEFVTRSYPQNIPYYNPTVFPLHSHNVLTVPSVYWILIQFAFSNQRAFAWRRIDCGLMKVICLCWSATRFLILNFVLVLWLLQTDCRPIASNRVKFASPTVYLPSAAHSAKAVHGVVPQINLTCGLEGELRCAFCWERFLFISKSWREQDSRDSFAWKLLVRLI